MLCEFTLMTIGDCRGGSTTPAPTVSRGASTRPSQRLRSAPALERRSEKAVGSAVQQPGQPASRSFMRDNGGQRPTRPSPPPPKPSIDPESLFLPDDDDDCQWNEKNYGEADEDMVGWDVSADNVSSLIMMRRKRGLNGRTQDAFAASHNRTIKDQTFSSRDAAVNNVDDNKGLRIAPTQRISQVNLSTMIFVDTALLRFTRSVGCLMIEPTFVTVELVI